MARKFATLRAAMAPERQKRVTERTASMLEEMPLGEIRRTREITQSMLAETLGAEQSSVSKLERRRDMNVSSLRNYIEALGGELVISARFPDGEYRVMQFDDSE